MSCLAMVAFALFVSACESAPSSRAAATAAPAAVAPGTAPAGYSLGPGDRIRVTVFGQEQLSGEYEVDGLGNVTLPLIGEVPAKGKTEGQVEKLITEKLSPEYLRDPNVSVDVLTYRPFYIFGEVNAPGSYPYVNGMTVINAIALAGGYTYRARTSSVNLIRASDPSGEPQTVPTNESIAPGDVIEVRERYF
jgi:polysaccharide export outer membrane protein